MNFLFLFLSGLLFANGIPHFIHGISGQEFHNPSLHRFFPNIPSPLFNVLWGLLNFIVSFLLANHQPGLGLGFNSGLGFASLGFAFASIGLSIYFKARQNTHK